MAKSTKCLSTLVSALSFDTTHYFNLFANTKIKRRCIKFYLPKIMHNDRIFTNKSILTQHIEEPLMSSVQAD
jgi:hypothetical protein